MESSSKITTRHLSRIAYVYIRQSTAYQVASNTESTLRQYALRDRLAALGWDESLIRVIDTDLGVSGKTAEDREGFVQLMADVANGKVGAIACIEASRLSRCSADWSRLIEICRMTEALLIDTDGIYDPNVFNDRLLLGLKGTMSEAELYYIQERMRGGLLNKARRGELKVFLPIGYEYDYDDNVIKTPDMRIRTAVEQFFELFRAKRSAGAVVKYFFDKGMKFPVRMRLKGHQHEVRWEGLNRSRAAAILHNPFYTGAYTYGRTQVKWVPGGGRRPMPVPMDEWHVDLPDHHEAYISKEEFEMNQSILRENTQKWGPIAKRTTPREGSALLQGICFCGYCGYRMSPVYSVSKATGRICVRYECKGEPGDAGTGFCRQSLPAEIIDKVISDIVIDKLRPESLALTLQVQEEVARRRQEHLKYYQLQFENARQDEEKARARYMSVDPGNRLVALQLETDWNKKIRAREDAASRYQEEAGRQELLSGKELEAAARSISENFDKIWNDPSVRNEDKKRIVRYLIKDVTLVRTQTFSAKIGICFQGGAVFETEVPVPKPRFMLISTPQAVLDYMEEHAEEFTYQELADNLNDNGLSRICGRPFDRRNVYRIMKDYNIRNKKQRYQEKGWLTAKEAAEKQGLTRATFRYRVNAGIYEADSVIVDENGTRMFDPATIRIAGIKGKNSCNKKEPRTKQHADMVFFDPTSEERCKAALSYLRENAERKTLSELAAALNEQGLTRTNGKRFDSIYLISFMKKHNIKTITQHHRDLGWTTLIEKAKRLGICPATLKHRIEAGQYTGEYVIVDSRGSMMFPPDATDLE